VDECIFESQSLLMYYLLQTNATTPDLYNRLPTFGEMVKYYGPYLALVLALIIAIVILQYVWFKRNLNAKDGEIKRLVEREQQLSERINHMIDQEIGYRKPKKS
jgi:hypothetical protein